VPSIVRASVTCWRWTMQLIVFRALLSESFRCRWVCRGTAGTLPTTQILNSRSCLTTLTVRLPVTTTAELRWLFVLLLCVFVEFCRWQAWLIVLMHCLLSQVNVCYTNCTVRKSAVLSSHAGVPGNRTELYVVLDGIQAAFAICRSRGDYRSRTAQPCIVPGSLNRIPTLLK